MVEVPGLAVAIDSSPEHTNWSGPSYTQLPEDKVGVAVAEVVDARTPEGVVDIDPSDEEVCSEMLIEELEGCNLTVLGEQVEGMEVRRVPDMAPLQDTLAAVEIHGVDGCQSSCILLCLDLGWHLPDC